MTEKNASHHADGQSSFKDLSAEEPQEDSIDPVFSVSKDYANTFTSPLLWVDILIRHPASSDARAIIESKLRQILKTRRTYTAYRLEELNTKSVIEGENSTDIESRLSQYTSSPDARTLDEIALSLVELGNSKLTADELAHATVRLCAKGYGITHGKKREKRALEIFGLEEEPTEPTT